VVEGSVRRAGERVRITAQLIEAATERHLWAKSYERDLTEVLALQGEVAAAIVGEIQVTVTPQEATLLRDAQAVNPAAYEAYLKGRHFIERRTEEALRQGLVVLDEAVRLDPTLVLAHVGVADAHNLMGFMTVVPPKETFPPAKDAALRALAIDPECAEALTSLAYVTLWYDWDCVESERLFRKAIDLAPRYWQAHLWMANMLIVTERYEEARDEAQIARTLDPMSNVAIAFSGWFPYWQGRFRESVRQLDAAHQLIPDFAPLHYWRGLSQGRSGLDAEAVASFERLLAMTGRTPMAVSGLATVHALAGRETAARELLAELETLGRERYASAYYTAQVHVALREVEEAFAALERAFEERSHWLAAIRVDPSLAALRSDPRHAALVARVESR
jgi:Tfp pilus assembly protein PilF